MVYSNDRDYSRGQRILRDLETRPLPQGFRSRLEWAVDIILKTVFNLREGSDYFRQIPLAGGTQAQEGRTFDFFHVETNTLWNVQGQYFHGQTSEQKRKVLADQMLAFSSGYRVILLFELPLRRDPIFVVREALQGRQVEV